MELCCETSFSIFNFVIANEVAIRNKKLVTNPTIFNAIKLLNSEMNADIVAFTIKYTLSVNILHTIFKICEMLCHLSVPFLVLITSE